MIPESYCVKEHLDFKLKNSNESKKFGLIALLPLHLRQEYLLVNYLFVDLWSPEYSINMHFIIIERQAHVYIN